MQYAEGKHYIYPLQLENIVVDGQYDGGVDALLTDPNSDTSDLVIAQSKYYTSITFDDIFNSIAKMTSFYKAILAKW